RATAPGCAEATIEIETTGEPTFEDGVTPIVADRPYIPPELSEQAKRSIASIVNVARDRPSRASSESPDHPARHGNDGHPDTHWQAGASDGHAWWQVDLEGYYQVASSRITFPAEGNWRFVVSISEDGQTWEEAVDRRATVSTAIARNDVYPPGAVARYWRIAFIATPDGRAPSLRDVELQGVLSAT
ncbi:MAG TPA: discoidin domain-containing protein, partial [Tepidisphaeraceae bacterium]|nr:discoidin domain-containing protein [Tepidisphaeraceae bacterium]